MLEIFERMDQDRKAARERELPEWALALPPDRQRMIRQAGWMVRHYVRERNANAARAEADAILYGTKL